MSASTTLVCSVRSVPLQHPLVDGYGGFGGVPRFPIDPSDAKPLGRSGERIAAIGIGTWGIRDYRAAERALLRAVELGLNVIDTAEMYDWGKAEELVGRVARLVGRDNVFIITKLLPERFRDCNEALKAARESLRRLGVSYVDLILIHWPDETTPVSRQVRCLELLAERGLTRYIGVSNFDLELLREALESTSKHEIVLNQVKYSVLDKRVEFGLLPFCIENRVTLQAYTPLERCMVSKHPRVREVASMAGKTPVQVALNYLISRPMVVAVPKSESVKHIEEIRGALGWRLDEKLIEMLEEI